MLGQVTPTEFDLQFRLFGIPVRVTPWFWLAGVVLGWSTVRDGRYDLLIVWLACLFASILVHEMGHAFTANAFGWPPRVFLYHFGGLAVFQPNFRNTTGRSVLVSFAGPAAGFILYGAVLAVEELLIATRTHPGEQAVMAIYQLKWINLYWGLVNLLPVLPLDGGRIAEALLIRQRPRDGEELALKLSILVSGAAAAYFFFEQQQYAAVLFALLCAGSIQSLQHARGRVW